MDRIVELLPMTAHAPTHLEGRVLIHRGHLLHRTVAALTFDPGPDVALVIELDVVREPVDLDPRHLLAALEVAAELLDLGLVRRRDLP